MSTVKTQSGTGANFNVTVPNSTKNPNGGGTPAQSASLPAVPSFGGNTGVPTERPTAADVPNRLTKQSADHGGTVSPSPGPLTKGFPGIPEKTSIPNR